MSSLPADDFPIYFLVWLIFAAPCGFPDDNAADHIKKPLRGKIPKDSGKIIAWHIFFARFQKHDLPPPFILGGPNWRPNQLNKYLNAPSKQGPFHYSSPWKDLVSDFFRMILSEYIDIFCLPPDLYTAAPCGRHPVGQQEVHAHEALRGSLPGRLYCRLTSLSQTMQTKFAHYSRQHLPRRSAIGLTGAAHPISIRSSEKDVVSPPRGGYAFFVNRGEGHSTPQKVPLYLRIRAEKEDRAEI